MNFYHEPAATGRPSLYAPRICSASPETVDQVAEPTLGLRGDLVPPPIGVLEVGEFGRSRFRQPQVQARSGSHGIRLPLRDFDGELQGEFPSVPEKTGE